MIEEEDWDRESIKGRVTLPNRMNFRKNSKRPSTPPPFSENFIEIVLENVRKKPFIKVQNLLYKFLDWKYPPLELLRKFIRFGSATLSRIKCPQVMSMVKFSPTALTFGYQACACAESARAFTGRRCPHSGKGEDFLTGQLNFFTETALTLDQKVEKWFPRWEINRHGEG